MIDASGPPTQRVNTLVHYVGSEAAIPSLRALVEGVRAGAREDAGLRVVVVLREGVLGRGGETVKAALRPAQDRPGLLAQPQGVPVRRVTLTFALPWARPCIAQLRRLQRLHEQAEARGDVTVAVIDRASAQDAHALATAQRLTYLVVPDPAGVIVQSFGIRVWPMTVTIDEHGRIAEIEPGADGGALAALAREGNLAPAAETSSR